MEKNVSTTLNKCPRVILRPFLKNMLVEKNVLGEKVSTALKKRPRVILRPFLRSTLSEKNFQFSLLFQNGLGITLGCSFEAVETFFEWNKDSHICLIFIVHLWWTYSFVHLLRSKNEFSWPRRTFLIPSRL